MQAEVIVVTMKLWDACADGASPHSDSLELFAGAQRQIATYLDEMKETASKEGSLLMADGKQVVVNER